MQKPLTPMRRCSKLHPPAGTQRIPFLTLSALLMPCPAWYGFPWCEDDETDLGRKSNTRFEPGKSLACSVGAK